MASAPSRYQERKFRFCRRVALCLAVTALLTIFTGCSKDLVHPAASAPAETVPTEPPATIPPDGDPQNVTCKGSYTTENFDSPEIVARIEDQELNNGKLNILYRLAVNAYQPREGEPAPDFLKPLDSQVCELPGDHITWQQYFLQQALDNWKIIQSFERRSHMPVIQNELNFEVDHERHDKYMVDIPINDTVLYGEDASFKLTVKEKPYLESLPEKMENLARDMGYGNLREMIEYEFGSGIPVQNFNDLVYLANYAYLYFVSLSYDPKPSEEDLQRILASMDPSDEKLVDMRHVLVYTEDAEVGEGGKLIADEQVWEASYNQAKMILLGFQSGRKQDDVAFSVLAHDHTKDEGSRLSGGLYANIHQGQMIKPLDDWLFAPDREIGDIEIIRSDYGWHIVYLKDIKDSRISEARKIFKKDHFKMIMEEMEYNYPITIAYDKIQLADLENKQGTVTMKDDLLYQDIGHERFPEVPVYIQQDYQKAPYGAYTVSSHGCGISALAMLSTYMADEPHTPATLAVKFGYYNGLHGTDMRMFTEAPPELGYFLYRRSGIWEEVEDNLRQGRMSISLQVKGYFTRAGHYLVLSHMTDDDLVVIRDSNVYNYQRLPEHKVDKFKPQRLLPNCQGFWIYDNKLVTVAACDRCGNPGENRMPKLFREDYVCQKCVPALERREVFLDLCRFI